MFCSSYFYPMGRGKMAENSRFPAIQKKIFEDVNINSALYLERYPLLKEIRMNADNNTILNNLIVDCENTFLRYKDSHIFVNNVQLRSDGNSLESFCNTEY